MNKRTCFGSIQLFSHRFDSTPSEGGVSAFAIHSLSIHIVFFLNFNETFILRAHFYQTNSFSTVISAISSLKSDTNS